jgi:ABC-type transporter Mla subunit MlaD
MNAFADKAQTLSDLCKQRDDLASDLLPGLARLLALSDQVAALDGELLREATEQVLQMPPPPAGSFVTVDWRDAAHNPTALNLRMTSPDQARAAHLLGDLLAGRSLKRCQHPDR